MRAAPLFSDPPRARCASDGIRSIIRSFASYGAPAFIRRRDRLPAIDSSSCPGCTGACRRLDIAPMRDVILFSAAAA